MVVSFLLLLACPMLAYGYVSDAHRHHVSVATAQISTVLGGSVGVASIVLLYAVLHLQKRMRKPSFLQQRRRSINRGLASTVVPITLLLLIFNGPGMFVLVGFISGGCAVFCVITIVRMMAAPHHK